MNVYITVKKLTNTNQINYMLLTVNEAGIRYRYLMYPLTNVKISINMITSKKKKKKKKYVVKIFCKLNEPD